MKTPICDFIKNYISQNTARLHMPGHKGCGLLGFEEFDITEITGADSLYEADGIIMESEQNASDLFGCHTFYSTEGSTQCIKAMLYLALTFSDGNKIIAAGRNAHKSFLSASALLDLEVDWLYGKGENHISLTLTADDVENYFKKSSTLPFAIYLTSPDYLGNRLDIKKIAEVCKKYSVLLLIDNAHGGYLKFLNNSEHPIDLGADMCATSAHKTLPVLTGGAYLQISKKADLYFKTNAKNALSLFGSTSPSYLILESLDMANKYLSTYKPKLLEFISKVDCLKSCLCENGFTLLGDEPLKLTIFAKPYGYLGYEIDQHLKQSNIVSEFFDADFITLMFTPETKDEDLKRLQTALLTLPKKEKITSKPPVLNPPIKKTSIRDAIFSKSEIIDCKNALGRISASPTVGCPPAIPIVISGEVIDEITLNVFEYYKIKKCNVVIEK
jgi:arginine/lysine/ornithine decarboxylase